MMSKRLHDCRRPRATSPKTVAAQIHTNPNVVTGRGVPTGALAKFRYVRKKIALAVPASVLPCQTANASSGPATNKPPSAHHRISLSPTVPDGTRKDANARLGTSEQVTKKQKPP